MSALIEKILSYSSKKKTTTAAKEEEAPKIEPVDIGNGFTMEEVTDEEAAEKGLEGLQDA